MFKTLITFTTALGTLFIPMVLVAWFLSLSIRTHYGGISVVSPQRLTASIVIPAALAIREIYRKSLSFSGIIAAMVVGFVLTLANASFIISLLVFFYSSTKLTRFRAERKANQDEEAEKGAQRTWLNVFNNGAVPTSLAFLYLIEVGCEESVIDFKYPLRYISSWLSVAVLGSLACACGDTWASEVGAAVGSGSATLISTGKTVPAGDEYYVPCSYQLTRCKTFAMSAISKTTSSYVLTRTNGGVTVVGTIASIAGGILVGLSFAITNYLFTDISSFQFSLIVAGGFAGFTGSLIDSILGATMQFSGFHEETKKVVSRPGPGVKHISGLHILNNHAINFISCCISSLSTPFAYQICVNIVDLFS